MKALLIHITMLIPMFLCITFRITMEDETHIPIDAHHHRLPLGNMILLLDQVHCLIERIIMVQEAILL
jgi:hypothetical protein